MPEETLVIDPEAWTVHMDGQTIPLTYLEFRLLLFLAEHPGIVHRRADLLRQVWAESPVSDRSVDLYVHRLREKLGQFGCRAIRTVVRVGYRFDLTGADFLRVQGRETAGFAQAFDSRSSD